MRKLKNEELERKTIDQFKKASKTPLNLVLDDIRSLNNIGSVFRSADAFLIRKIYLCGITATPPHRDIHKTALGATDSVAWEYSKTALEIVQKLQNNGVSVWAIEQTEKSLTLNKFEPKKNKEYAFVLGNEVKGVSQEVINTCGQTLEIPQFGTKHSLNVSVTAGLVLWDFFTKMKH